MLPYVVRADIIACVAGGCGQGDLLARPNQAQQIDRAGQAEFNAQGCTQCHTVDGTPGIAPTLRNVYGSMRPLEDGHTVLAGEDYLRRSILDHTADIVQGYPDTGPDLSGQMTVAQLERLVDFLRSISEHTTNDEQAPEAQEPGQPEPASEPG